jgi:hypothetical protein
MSAPRNFRKILDVDPDSPRFHCVGETRGGGRCGQFMFSGSDLSQASAILTKMDSQTLKSSYRYLEELAFLTLCARWHRRPERSQIGLVTWRWRQKIQQLEKEEAEMALNLMTRRRPVAWKAVAVEEVMAAVKEERTEKVTCTFLAAYLSPVSNHGLSDTCYNTAVGEPFVCEDEHSLPSRSFCEQKQFSARYSFRDAIHSAPQSLEGYNKRDFFPQYIFVPTSFS